MLKKPAFGSVLLVTSALSTPAFAQGASVSSSPSSGNQAQIQRDAAGPGVGRGAEAEEQVDISIPGGSSSSASGDDIVVTGRYIPNVIKQTPQVVSVLSAGDIARTGEGDIAGALQRVTGLSVVGEGFVYVRGLGDRYSLSLLNGSPLPSPDPLRRVVPLDIFPSSLIASGLVQKSYSPNFPGEYGGGVINLTTLSTPKEAFVKVGGSVAYDSFTTRGIGYSYYGSKSDWLGYDSGSRNTPDFINQAGAVNGNINNSQQVASLTNSRTTLLQRMTDTPANWSADLSAGKTFELGAVRLGVIASGGISNSWMTRDALREGGDSAGTRVSSFRVVATDNRILVNGLLGLGLEFGEHKLRLTNLYIHDTLKQGRLESGYGASFGPPAAGQPNPQMVQGTSWAERQLYDLQGAAELRFGDLSVDLRGTYANTKRKAPYERQFNYVYNSAVGDYVNNLTGGDQRATIAFSDLNEDLYAGGIDVGYEIPSSMPIKVTAGYAYSDTKRVSSRYDFLYSPGVGSDIAQLRPDYLLSRDVILSQNITLRNNSNQASSPIYEGKLRIHGGYGMLDIEPITDVRVSGGVRYESADQSVQLTPSDRFPGTTLSNDYWLPSLTLTWNFRPNMQFRIHGSKTIARPQFRELAQQEFQDFSTNRLFIGNPTLVDSELKNAEARFEWFFARDQRFSVAAFYKDIKNPIETIGSYEGASDTVRTYFGNAPKAKLYGVEFELQKYFPLDTVFGGDLFATKRLVAIANYTYSKSELEIGNELIPDPVPQFGVTRAVVPAASFFRDGAPMTGQSDHLVNLQLGIEDTERLSQLTLLFNYASPRVTLRGPLPQVDFIERPGIRLDIVYRQAIPTALGEIELKAEARNLTKTDYRETQDYGNGRVITTNSYRQGSIFQLGASVKF